ncbi:bifunctional DNA-formamidopyrimidine glycosylase/DNA-(apurinic or apyrimidinic site) lyase [Arboricoccus pini]|uniref:bifunctional DNA-formamidopyrimidine glycosylase/DNA-(apurinic or apyrimidinic site) lyase n=1 Tax=Arboricoccus pini TaxID=1963835 RepID=UPI000B502D9B|nr:bifunctional DNA-formamidopyrimidine glycosylase/DNA-(apurinic or apyrimidinic site) lyase [Arboricoccus pini]
MPELPEVETVMRAMRLRLIGRRLLRLRLHRPDLRFPIPPGLADQVAGLTVTSLDRRAKYILVHMGEEHVLLLHLGMSGRLVFDGPAGALHEHVTFEFDDDTMLRFIDPRRFGMLDISRPSELSEHRWLRHLGEEPLGAHFTGRCLKGLLGRSRSAIKTAIMDQRRVVGVGNIYASEALFEARIAPTRPAGELSMRHATRLAEAIQSVLRRAIDAGGSSLRDYVQANGELGNFQRFFQVYDREGNPCVVCGDPISRTVQGGRATYFCAACQR